MIAMCYEVTFLKTNPFELSKPEYLMLFAFPRENIMSATHKGTANLC